MNFKEYYKTPYIGAGIVFVTSKNKILLLQKKNKKWTFPGGHAIEGETPKQTAKRECIEELGDIVSGLKITCKPLVIDKKEKPLYSFFLRIDKPFKPKLSNEHIDYKWFVCNKIKPEILTSVFKPFWEIYKEKILNLK